MVLQVAVFQKWPPEGRPSHETYVCFQNSPILIESKKAIHDIGTKIRFGVSVNRKPNKNWKIENLRRDGLEARRKIRIK